MQCPCGCGRKVGLTRRGAANLHGEAVGMAVVIAEAFGKLIDERSSPAKGETSLDKFHRESSLQTLTIYKNRAALLPGYLIEHIHGSPERGTPKLMELGGQVNEQREWLKRLAQGQDPLGF
jgi:hypothetical protein